MVPKESGFNQSETACNLWQEMVKFLSSRRHNLPSKLKLRNNQAIRNVGMWMYNNTIIQKELCSRFLTSTYAARVSTVIGDAAKVPRWRH